MPARVEGAARDRVVAAAMELFGRQGYRATTVAEIEDAAGLSPGAGGLYRHFRSKRALLEDGLRRQIDAGLDLRTLLGGAATVGESLVDRLRVVAVAGLRRLEHERDLNRLLLRDLAAFPQLLALVQDRELRSVHQALLAWLRTEVGDDGIDLEAVAAVLMGAVSHYWLMTDVFSGRHPLDISESRYIDAVVEMAAVMLGQP